MPNDDMSASIEAVEKLLDYEFSDKTLLEKALTHNSYMGSESYLRLAFLGDAVLGLAISNFAFLTYPDFDHGDLSIFKADNISREKLARVAVRQQLDNYVRHNSRDLNDQFKKFVEVVQREDGIAVHSGTMNAPKVLAEIVESIIGAVYLDNKSDLKAMWMVLRGLLEPLIILNVNMDICADEDSEVEAAAKKKMHEVCVKKKWSKPCYRILVVLILYVIASSFWTSGQ